MSPELDQSRRSPAEEMVAATPLPESASKFLPGVMAFAPIFAGNVVLASVLHAKSPVLALAAVASFAFSMHLWAGRLTDYIAAARAGLPLERLRRDLIRRRGPGVARHRIGDVDPSVWVAVPAPDRVPRVPETRHGGRPAAAADHAARPGAATEGDTQPGAETQGDTRPDVVAQGDTRPGVAAQSDTRPGVAAKGETRPGAPAPGDRRPAVAAQGDTSPDAAAQGRTQPREAAPGDTRPGAAAQGGTRPGVATKSGARSDVAAESDTPPTVALLGAARPGKTGVGRAARGDLVFRLCIARRQERGEPVTLAFSDGTTQAWHPATRVVIQPRPAGRPGPVREAAVALESLVRDISRNGSTSLESVIKNHSEEHPEPIVHHAVQAAVLWGLIATADGRDAQRLYALLSEPNPAEAAGIALTITHAGRVWLDCGADRGRHPSSGLRPRGGPTRTEDAAPATRGPSRAEGPTRGPSRTDNATHGPSRADDAVLVALTEVLGIPEVWERPGLRPARRTLTTAVAGGHPDSPAVRSAVDQVLTLAGGLVLGVAGAGPYQILRTFAG